jgi:hypothetical protein
MSERYPRGFPTLTWILPSAGFRMDNAARDAASEITKAFASAIRSMATLIEGTGFQAAAVRSIIGGLDLLTRAEAPRKVFSELPTALSWSNTFYPDGRHETEKQAEVLGEMRKAL